MNKTFGTNKGILLGIILWGIILMQFYRVGLPGIVNLELLPILTQLLILTLVGIIWFGIKYQITEKQLIIKLGSFTTFKVNIKNIDSITRSYNPLSSPAPSLRRINLKLRKGGFLLLSPKNEEQFIRELTNLNPEIGNNVNEKPTNGLKKFFLQLL